MHSLKELFDNITTKLHSGEHLMHLDNILEEYKAQDWHDHIKFSDIRYVKNLVFSNEYIDVFIICWNINQSSGIHDHPENGCLMKVLDGKLREDVYTKNNNQYEFMCSSTLEKDGIAYKEGNQCIHNIINAVDKTISLHIYSPSGFKTTYY